MTPQPAPSPAEGQELPTLLFTAFEPSGDDHAAAVVAELKRRHPALPIFAWGGRAMRAAGAEIVEPTGDDAVMGVPGIAKIREHQLINERIAAWLDAHRVAVHVPVDSPAANFPVCALAKKRGIKVVHLVAPQIWAWGRWRIHKLRRLTDLVLCLLPFEARFFEKRGVPARFIGHMLFDTPLDLRELDRRAKGFGEGEPRIAMMPGSRPEELRRNFPFILDVFERIRREYPKAVGVVAATRPEVADELRRIAGEHHGWPAGVSVVVRDTDAVVRWCQVALVKSGTVTLQVAKQGKPMVIFYRKSNALLYPIARGIIATKLFALPNVIAGREIVPEFIPHFGGPDPIVDELRKLLADPEAARRQRADIAEMLAPFQGLHAGALAADAIEEVAGILRVSGPEPVGPATPAPVP